MPELPEITLLARQMKAELVGKTITRIEVLQPKCLNVTPEEFTAALSGARLLDATSRGKWVQVETSQGWLLLCLGMGGEILLVTRAALPEKRRLIFDFSDGACLAVNFWWFGYAHFAGTAALHSHTMTATLGPNALDLGPAELQAVLQGRRGQLKTFLLDQSRIAGIGNFYVHDILFQARLHPLRPIQSLSGAEIATLSEAIHSRLELSLAKRGAAYELNLYGQKGTFDMADLLVAYKEGQPCPNCSTPVVKIRTGGTSSFICPVCQK
jgi:formamidopyrimidine-DNA glycosylase